MTEDTTPDDDEILEVLERLGPKWNYLKEAVTTAVTDALQQSQAKKGKEPEGSGSYLERQNAMLLKELLQLRSENPLTPDTPGDPSDGQPLPPVGTPRLLKKQPAPVLPEPRKPFWR